MAGRSDTMFEDIELHSSAMAVHARMLDVAISPQDTADDPSNWTFSTRTRLKLEYLRIW